MQRLPLLLLLTIAPAGFAQTIPGQQSARPDRPADLPNYTLYRAGTSIRIDGRLDEPAWVAAPPMGEFHFPWITSGTNQQPTNQQAADRQSTKTKSIREQTVAKMLWDDENLYVSHICQDAWITARYTRHDDPIPEDDCLEVMIVPDPARGDFYYNIEWNLLGGYVDGHRPRGADGPRVAWDATGLRIAGSYEGTLNNDKDRDAYWIGEVAIPLENFRKALPRFPPADGDCLRLNLNRHGGSTNMQYSQWSPADTPHPSFHTPHRFGRVRFSSQSQPFATASPP